MNDRGRGRTRFGTLDSLQESALSIVRYPARSLLTAIGTLLGTLAFVATVGLTGTVSHQVSSSFDIRRATTITATDPSIATPSGTDGPETSLTSGTPQWTSSEALARADSIAGIDAVGARSTLQSLTVSRPPFGDISVTTSVMGFDSGALDALGIHLVSGRSMDAGNQQRHDRVALVSSAVADKIEMGITGTSIEIRGVPFTVLGIYDDAQRDPSALAAVIVPFETLEEILLVGDAPAYGVLASTMPGAARQAGDQLPYALHPEEPELLKVVAPPDSTTLRQEVERGVVQLSLLASLIALVSGAVSIGNATTAATLQRTAEIGLRRALGASRIHIFRQLMGETIALGTLGGVIGTVLGIGVVVGVALMNNWTPLLDPMILLLSVFSGAATGLVAGIAPAIRATRVSPATALTL